MKTAARMAAVYVAARAFESILERASMHAVAYATPPSESSAGSLKASYAREPGLGWMRAGRLASASSPRSRSNSAVSTRT